MEMTSALAKLQEEHNKIVEQRDETIRELRTNNELMRSRMKSEVQHITSQAQKQVQQMQRAAQVTATRPSKRVGRWGKWPATSKQCNSVNVRTPLRLTF